VTITTNDQLPKIAITAGEPAGVGPDLCIMQSALVRQAQLIVIGDAELIYQRSRQLKHPITIKLYKHGHATKPNKVNELLIMNNPLSTKCKPGLLNVNNGSHVIENINLAVDGCLDGIFSAMVTAPVHKGILNKSNIKFTGHTEWIARKTKTKTPVMMLSTEGLRVALVTTHLPISQVSLAITKERLEDTIRVLHLDMIEKIGITSPNILVAGLNPHAGESGYIGTEEINIITPVLEKLKTEGMKITGPLPADTIFNQYYLDKADVVLAMYHDQGLPVIKYKGFNQTVNFTMGLPIIRTSVDHGTALDLASTGLTNAGSLNSAIDFAINIVTRQQFNKQQST